jgi:hypothetical protein
LALAINSWTDVMPLFRLAIWTCGVRPTLMIGSKSLIGS